MKITPSCCAPYTVMYVIYFSVKTEKKCVIISMLAGLKIMLKITYKQMNDINRIKETRDPGWVGETQPGFLSDGNLEGARVSNTR